MSATAIEIAKIKPELEKKCVDALRILAMDTVEAANSGHPGLPMGAAPMAYVLWTKHLRHNPRAPHWVNRDRFVLSAGHGSALLYSLLHLTGYALTVADLRRFRQWESRTPGHPETFMTPGVEATTGPLGQGSANAVGMAIAERKMASMFNTKRTVLVDHFTYALVSDGDLMEGLSAEAASLAGHLKLGKLIYLYDANDISLDGPTSLAFTENVGQRYEAYGWQVLEVQDGNLDLAAIDQAIKDAKACTDKPSLIIVRTTIGYGSPNKSGKSDAHGSPLGPTEAAKVREALGWELEEPFAIPQDVLSHYRRQLDVGAELQVAWAHQLDAYQHQEPELAKTWQTMLSGQLPEGWNADLPRFDVGKKVATRVASGQVINALAAKVPWLLGGDADLSCSTKTGIKNGGSFDGQTGAGRNIHYGVREHAMAAIANGIAYHWGIRSFVSTFFVFSDYMRPSVRLAALNQLPVIHVWTHDSIGVGEDGPTHQPVEHLAALRCMPNFVVIRPGDANETTEAWQVAMERLGGPTGLVLSRQDLPTLERSASAEGVRRGAYILRDVALPQAIVMATGSELHLAVAAAEQLQAENIGVRVVSMPSWELFAAQDADYRETVLPKGIQARVSIEAGVTMGWERWVGANGRALGVDRYGASAPGDEVMQHYGMTAEAVVAAVKDLLSLGTLA